MPFLSASFAKSSTSVVLGSQIASNAYWSFCFEKSAVSSLSFSFEMHSLPPSPPPESAEKAKTALRMPTAHAAASRARRNATAPTSAFMLCSAAAGPSALTAVALFVLLSAVASFCCHADALADRSAASVAASSAALATASNAVAKLHAPCADERFTPFAACPCALFAERRANNEANPKGSSKNASFALLLTAQLRCPLSSGVGGAALQTPPPAS
ncbi:hypothetical protein ERJ75_000591600 [Trypanosoma vivax]|nr:hypothetical protein ERJ75_000591600 [Trypanosoma vivax]